MTTILINDKSTAAKKMIEYLKTQSYVTIIEESIPSESLMKSINEAKAGKVTRTKSTTDLLEKLKSSEDLENISILKACQAARETPKVSKEDVLNALK